MRWTRSPSGLKFMPGPPEAYYEMSFERVAAMTSRSSG
jgi:4-hydroxyphenylpyruvate dioxygenase-like putative hemolysin